MDSRQTLTTVTVTCPSCGLSKEVPAESIPSGAVSATCRACGHSFPLPGRIPSSAEISSDAGSGLGSATAAPSAETQGRGPAKAAVIPSRSQFVTAVAWVFIVLCGFSTFISILQNVMINTMFPLDEMKQVATSAAAAPEVPAFFAFMLGNVRLFFASFLVVSAAMLGAAIGLLKRKNWARIVFIVNLSLGIAWNIGGMAVQFFVMKDFPKPVGAPPEFAARFSAMTSVIMGASVVMALAVSALLGWIIKRLVSVEVRGEFSEE